VLDEHERRHVQRGADAEKLVKSNAVRAVSNWFLVIYFPAVIISAGDAASFERPVHPDMPFAHARGGVALLLQHCGNREPPGLDQPRAESFQHALLQARPPVVTPGEDAVTRRAANRGT